MLNRIIDFSINNKFIVGLFTVVLIGAGLWSMSEVPVDAQPDITNNQVQVITQAPNLSTVDIEQFVTYPVEVAMSNLPGVLEIRSVSRFGLSVVTVVFEDEQGTYLPRQLVSEKLNEVQDEIPEGFGEPSIGPISTGLGEIYQYTLEVEDGYKDDYTSTELRTIQDWIVRRQMAMVPGVVEVNGVGGSIKQFEVAVDPDELRAIGVSIADIFTALEQNNQNTGGAYIERNHQANFIRGEGLARSVEDLENIVVKNADGIPITIEDVATVQIGSAVRYGALTKNGEGETVGGMVMMLKGANSNEQLNQLNYFVLTSDTIGNEKPVVIDESEVNKEELKERDKTYYYDKFCSFLVNRTQRIGRLKKRDQNIVLSVENIEFDKEELYFVIQIENKSSLDYDVNFLNFGIETRQKGKRKSSQTIYKKPLFKHGMPSKITEGSTERLVYVLPKFSLGDDRRVILELNEKNGGRNIKLKVPHKYINNPN